MITIQVDFAPKLNLNFLSLEERIQKANANSGQYSQKYFNNIGNLVYKCLHFFYQNKLSTVYVVQSTQNFFGLMILCHWDNFSEFHFYIANL